MNFIEERKKLVEFGKKMKSEGLSPGTSGNLSIYVRDNNTVLITPSGIDYDETEIEDIVAMDLEGKIIEGNRKPSSEWHLHTLFYKNKPHINAIVHTHSVFVTCLSVLNMAIEPVHYVVADTNAYKVPCCPYVRYGTEKLAKLAVKTAGKSDAVLLANHGIVTCGKNINSAFSLAKNLEYVAEIQMRTMAIGKPNILTEDQMIEVMEGFKTYGQTK